MGHIFVTGPSGAGKSTLAELLGRHLALPVVSVDREPPWKAHVRPAKYGLSYIREQSNTDSEAYHNYDLARRMSVYSSLDRVRCRDAVIEGCQLLGALHAVTAGSTVVCVNAPMELAVKQRLGRKAERLAACGQPPMNVDEAEISRLVGVAAYVRHLEELAALSNAPGVKVATSHAEIARLVDQLSRNRR